MSREAADHEAPPKWLLDEACVAWPRLVARCRATAPGFHLPFDTALLAAFAAQAAVHVVLQRAIHDGTVPLGLRAGLVRESAAARRAARLLGRELGLVPDRCAFIAEIGPVGEDLDLARLLGLADEPGIEVGQVLGVEAGQVAHVEEPGPGSAEAGRETTVAKVGPGTRALTARLAKPKAPSRGAAKMKALRTRRALGLGVFPLELFEHATVDRLIDLGLLPERDAADQGAVLATLAAIVNERLGLPQVRARLRDR